jgi:hypothetical protein
MIIASAVKLKDGRIFVGKRHEDAIRNAMIILGIRVADKRLFNLDDGFITSDLCFLKREEALVYAKKNGQFKREKLWLGGHPKETEYRGYNGTKLFSEDLW